MKIVCCICKKVLVAGPVEPVSHGHCSPCSVKWLWLNGLDREDLTEFVKEHNPDYTPVGGGEKNEV